MTSSESLVRTLARVPWPRAGCISATVLMLTQYHSSLSWGELLHLCSGMTILVALPLAAEAVHAKIRTKTLPILALVSILGMGALGVARAEVPTTQFNIPPGDALQTVPEFSRQSKVEVGYLIDALRGVKTNAIEGTFPVDAAIERMLKSTDLEPRFEQGHQFVSIVRRENTPEPVLPSESVPQVVVTGTLIRGSLDIMSPLEIVTSNEMKKTVYATVQDAVEMLPLVTGPGPREDLEDGDNLDRGASANLRSLGADATLVLVNGKRQPVSGAKGTHVDLSNIPSSIIERIEVLPDGASALYGADAIAGVVNVITRKGFEGSETHVRFSAPRGGGDGYTASQLFGRTWETGKVIVAYEYSGRSALPATERYYSANADKRPLGGTDFRTSIAGNIFDPITLLPVYGVPTEADGKPLTAAELRPDINLQNQYSSVELLPSRQMHSGYVSATQKWGDRIELFAEGRYSQRRMTLSVFPEERLLMVPAWNPHFLQVFDDAPVVLVGYGFGADLGPAIGRARTSVMNGSIEARGRIGNDWQATLSHSYGTLKTEYADYNRVDSLRLAAALADSDPSTAFNPFATSNQQNAAVLEAIRSVRAQGTSSSISTTTLLADGPVMEWPSGTTHLAVGSEVRWEEFATGAPIEDRFFRRVKSLFAEVAVPLIGAPDDYSRPRLELSLAARADHYDDVGDTFNPKIGLRWIPSRDIRLRATWGTSSKAPRVMDIGPSSQSLDLLVDLPDPMSPSGRSIVLARQGSNPRLGPETATTWTVGADITPSVWPGFRAALTYHATSYVDRVILPGPRDPFDVLVEQSLWAEMVERNPSRAAIESICRGAEFRGLASQCESEAVGAIVDFRVRNMGALKVRGLDLGVKYLLVSRVGVFETSLKSSYVTAFERQLSSTSPSENIVDTAGHPLRLRMQGSLDWYMRSVGGAGPHVGLAVSHAGSYRDSLSSPHRSVSALTTLDFWASYRTSPGTSLGDVEVTLGVVNVFDAPPPFLDRAIGYDVVHGDPYGRVAVMSVQKMW